MSDLSSIYRNDSVSYLAKTGEAGNGLPTFASAVTRRVRIVKKAVHSLKGGKTIRAIEVSAIAKAGELVAGGKLTFSGTTYSIDGVADNSSIDSVELERIILNEIA